MLSMKKTILLTTTILFLAFSNMIPIVLADQPNSPPFIKGERINVFFGGGVAYVDQPYHVVHGWVFDNWSERTTEEKMLFRSGYGFELEIDGVSVPLRPYFWFHKTWNPGFGSDWTDVMITNFYVNFPAYSFSAGEYTFRGIWYTPDGSFDMLAVVTFLE